MKRILTVIFLFILSNSYSQILQTKYFNNSFLEKETTPDRGKFMQTITQNSDGSVTTQIINVKKSEIVSTEILKGEEPVGVWRYKKPHIPNELDYAFDLIYWDKACKDSIAGVGNYFENNDSVHYVAPKISTGEKTIYNYIANNLIYPPLARVNDIQGKAYLTFTITKDGNVENIVVKEGAHITLDKEAVRVVRKLKFSTPPILKAKLVEICVTLPISFKLM